MHIQPMDLQFHSRDDFSWTFFSVCLFLSFFCCLGFHIEFALAIHASDRETIKKSMKILSDYYIWIGTCVADMQSLQVSAAIFHQTNELNLWNENQSETINGSVNEFRPIFFSADRLGKKGQSTEKLTVFVFFPVHGGFHSIFPSLLWTVHSFLLLLNHEIDLIDYKSFCILLPWAFYPLTI